MKEIFLFFMFCFPFGNSIAQGNDINSKNILDYYFPSEKNKSILVSKIKGEENGGKKEIFYIKKNNDKSLIYETVEKMSVDGIATSITSYTLKVSSNQISISHANYSSTFFTDKTEKDYNPPQVILKLPKNGKIEKWKCKLVDDFQCQSEYTKVVIDGTERNAIKIYKKPLIDGKYDDGLGMYEFYVEGIGLWKMQFHDGTDFIVLKEQKFDSSIPKN